MGIKQLIEEFGVAVKDLLNKATVFANDSKKFQGKDEETLLSEISKEDAGLGNVENFGPSTPLESEEGLVENKYSTADAVGLFVDRAFPISENALYFFTETNTPLAIGSGNLATPVGLVETPTEQFYILNLGSNPYNLSFLFNFITNNFYIWNGSSWVLTPTPPEITSESLEVGRFYFNPYTNRLFFYDLNQNLVRF